MYCHDYNMLAQIVQIVHRVGTTVTYTDIPWSVPCDKSVGDSEEYVRFALMSNPFKYACDHTDISRDKMRSKPEKDAVVIYATALLCTDKVIETAPAIP